MENENKKYYNIGVLSKTFMLIETLSTKSSFELRELSKILSMPKTTVHRILLTLCDEGYVTHYGGGRYALSYKLFSVGRKVLSSNSVMDIAKPYMAKLLEDYNETVNLCVASGTDMVIIDKLSTSHALKPDNIVGTSFAIFYSASGKALMAFASEKDFQDLMDKIKKETKPKISAKEYKAFLEEVAEVKRTGIAYDNEEIYEGVRCIASPILNYDDVPIAALSISAPSARLSQESIETLQNALIEVTKNISRQLGSSC